MNSKLKSYTIVPDSLYVERRADKQLHHIIESMQRPGYVLVSRQMGKTNLLLREKRKWENKRDLYVYIDMSNINGTEKECFEFLIDTAIDTHEEQLSSIREKITELRKNNISKNPVQAHNEELRTLLQIVENKIVFILDEIDSLTRTNYSDNIFSQIRSVFFSRINYPVLEKVTYVLSGVVEPTEIIKNPKISPFNIGEKILLDDFNYEEFRDFIKKADLESFGKDIIERIFFWTGGNPRITWDICYELQYKKEINIPVLDSLVKSMYLTTFDKAPVDTIRNIVKEDRDLREAIIQISYNKGYTLSDKIKNKLYLAGIINYEENDIKIKNRILKESLSLNWLQKIEEEEKGLLNYAIELHSKGQYKDSLNRFDLFLKNNDFTETMAPIYYYVMGSCYYHLMDFDNSLKYLCIKPLDYQKNPYEYRHANFLAGADCLKLADYKKSLEFFNEAMKGEDRDWVYYSAKLNELNARQQLVNGNLSEIKEIEMNYLDLMALPNEESNEAIKYYATTQLASLYIITNPDKVCSTYDEALKFAKGSARIRLLVYKFEFSTNDEREIILEELISLTEKINDISHTQDPDRNLDLDEEIFTQILYIIFTYAFDKWDIIKNKVSLLPTSYGDSLYMIFNNPVSSQIFNKAGSARLIKILYDNINSNDYNISESLKISIIKKNAFFNYSDNLVEEFLYRLKDSEEKIDTISLIIIRIYISHLFERKNFNKIINEINWIFEKYPEIFLPKDIKIRAYIEYLLLYSYYMMSDISSAKRIASIILDYIDDEITISKDQDLEILNMIKNSAISVLRPMFPIIDNKLYGRNDRVKVKYLKSELIIEKKYKHVQQDIDDGKCIIIIDK